MKKLSLLFTVLFFAGITQLFAAKPIPSFNVKVSDKANFQEMKTNLPGIPGMKEKRLMNIETTTSVPNTGKSFFTAIVYVYKLNGSKVFGPFYVEPGELLTVPIDNGKWGVAMEMVHPSQHIEASVWTNKGPQ